MKEVIGALMDEGYSPTEVREMVGPLLSDMDDWEESDLGSHVLDRVVDESGHEQAVREILTQARDSRRPPGPQIVVPSGVIHSLPESKAAKAVRVDTEDSYRRFRNSLPDDSVDALSQVAQNELMGYFERGYASQVIGNVMDHEVASVTSLHDNPNTSDDQCCLLCGVPGGSAVCGNCHDRLPDLIGLFERGYASQVIGLFERGSAANLYDDNPTATVIGDGFYRRSSDADEMIGDGFYRMNRHEGYASGLSALIGDVMALSVPSGEYDEEIPLSFHKPEMYDHISAWKRGASIYGSIRVTGWDRQPYIITGVTSYPKEVGIVVGYSTSASIPPSATLSVIDPLARQLGASAILPQLAAAAPAVLRVSSENAAPLVLTAMPAGQQVKGSWV